jgi:hypothetical protein
MSIPALAVTKTLSKQEVARLENLGATVTWGTVSATEAQMWAARIIGKKRVLLEKRGNMALSHHFP